MKYTQQQTSLVRAALIWHGARTLSDQNYSVADKYLKRAAIRFLKTKPKIKWDTPCNNHYGSTSNRRKARDLRTDGA